MASAEFIIPTELIIAFSTSVMAFIIALVTIVLAPKKKDIKELDSRMTNEVKEINKRLTEIEERGRVERQESEARIKAEFNARILESEERNRAERQESEARIRAEMREFEARIRAEMREFETRIINEMREFKELIISTMESHLNQVKESEGRIMASENRVKSDLRDQETRVRSLMGVAESEPEYTTGNSKNSSK